MGVTQLHMKEFFEIGWENGFFTLFFLIKSGLGGSLDVGLQNTYVRLKYTWDMGFDMIILENDCLEAMLMIKDGYPMYHPCMNKVRKITNLIALDRQVEVRHIYCDKNSYNCMHRQIN